MNYDIIVFGSAGQDVFVSLKDARIIIDPTYSTAEALCVPFGSKIPVNKLVFASGGGGTNAAVTFARQGLRTTCLGIVAKDYNGAAVLDELRREGVDAKYVQMHEEGITAFSVVLVGEGGERTILVYKGEGAHWQPQKISWDSLKAPWAYVNSLDGSDGMLQAITDWARTEKIHLATNPGTKELEMGLDRLAPHWKYFDIVGMNQEEAAQLTGISFDRQDDIFKAMDQAIGGIFIMTLGSEGVVVSDGTTIYRAGIPSQEVVERTGAGDAFHSGFVTEFMRSGNIEKAIQFGTANASSVVMQYGAKAGILKKDQAGHWPPVSVKRRKL